MKKYIYIYVVDTFLKFVQTLYVCTRLKIVIFLLICDLDIIPLLNVQIHRNINPQQLMKFKHLWLNEYSKNSIILDLAKNLTSFHDFV